MIDVRKVIWIRGVAAIHILAGLILLGFPDVKDVSWTSDVTELIGTTNTAVLFITAGVAAWYSVILLPRLGGVIFVGPQFCLLMFSAFSVATSIISGCYANGYCPPGDGTHDPVNGPSFIALDQMFLMFAIIGHTMETLWRFDDDDKN
jgi:hypothetical protein